MHQRHGEFEQLLLSERQAARAQKALLVETDKGEQLLGALDGVMALACKHVEQSRVAVRDRDQHVLQAAHLAVNASGLERAQHAQARNLLHPEAGDLSAIEANRARIDWMVADDRVEERGLARAVGPDEAGDAPTRHRE